LLADPEIQAWLEQQRTAIASAPATAVSAAGAASSGDSGMAGRIDAMREHIGAVIDAVPHVPGALAAVFGTLHAEMNAHGRSSVLVLLVVFAALGFGVEGLFWLASGRVRRRIIGARLDTPGERMRVALARLAFGAGWVAAFALGSIGAFLAFDWPPMMREALLGLLVALVMTRMAVVLGRFLFAPGAERFRLVPMDTAAAWFWHRRLVLMAGWFAFAVAVIQWMAGQGVEYGVWRVVAYAASAVLLGLTLEAVWCRPGARSDRIITVNWLLTVAFGMLLLLRIISANHLFWLGALGLAVYGASRLIAAVSAHLQRPPDGVDLASVAPSIDAALVARSVRLALIVAAGLVLVLAWDIDLAELMAADTLGIKMLRGAFQVVAVVLLADMLWYVFKASVERRLAQAQSESAADPQSGNAMRLRTVLPILRNVVFVSLVVMTVLMALSGLGVEIGPLVAGAGVVGIAVGFGAQTLVKDIMCGVFYLLDDAFRVGEYIQSGTYKGTVESFSLRSVKLRHHRGPVYTVPFGDLGAVQNMSRNWVIDKLTVGITYDSNLEKARKLIKAIGQQLAADPEMGPNIIEPLKMQGVEQFGDFAIQIRMKMMTRPGEQFVIRRKALAMIKIAFDENGIKFAFPTVQIAGGGAVPSPAAAAAAAQQVLGAQHAPGGA